MRELPPEFLDGLDIRSRWLYTTIYDMQSTVNDLKVTVRSNIEETNRKHAENEKRFQIILSDVEDLQKTKLILLSKWSIIAFVVGAVLWPLALIFIGRWIAGHFP